MQTCGSVSCLQLSINQPTKQLHLPERATACLQHAPGPDCARGTWDLRRSPEARCIPRNASAFTTRLIRTEHVCLDVIQTRVDNKKDYFLIHGIITLLLQCSIAESVPHEVNVARNGKRLSNYSKAYSNENLKVPIIRGIDTSKRTCVAKSSRQSWALRNCNWFRIRYS